MKREMVARLADLQLLTHAQLLVHMARAASAFGVELHSDAIDLGIARVDERVAANQPLTQMQVDMGAGLNRRCIQGVVQRLQIEADDVSGLQPDIDDLCR